MKILEKSPRLFLIFFFCLFLLNLSFKSSETTTQTMDINCTENSYLCPGPYEKHKIDKTEAKGFGLLGPVIVTSKTINSHKANTFSIDWTNALISLFVVSIFSITLVSGFNLVRIKKK